MLKIVFNLVVINSFSIKELGLQRIVSPPKFLEKVSIFKKLLNPELLI
jgi:hypothetical protein